MDTKNSLKNKGLDDFLFELARFIAVRDLISLEKMPQKVHIYCKDPGYESDLGIVEGFTRNFLLRQYSSVCGYYGPILTASNSSPVNGEYSIEIDTFILGRKLPSIRPATPANALPVAYCAPVSLVTTRGCEAI